MYFSQRPAQYDASSGEIDDGSSVFFSEMRASGVGDVFSPGTELWGTGRSSIPKRGSPVTRSNMNSMPIFVTSATPGIVLPSFTASKSVGAAARSKSQMSWWTNC
ncbi:MAG: hypothetical protein DMF97_16610 [Acidobacteria bacterium]|nr:MAG: hypothetical protein DMF97_16610 [Acidobacteriota bacterium]